jgi:endothelin-converting enzyme/putative endopeptidase
VGADDKNSSKNSLSVGVGRLGLPDQDYYSSQKRYERKKR